jgi:transposase
MVANRVLAPGSKLAVEDWVKQDVHIDGLSEVPVQNLYRSMDFLLEAQEELQKNIFFEVSNLLKLEVDLLYFDTTSTYFEIEDADDAGSDKQNIRQYGNSKDHRPDRPQAAIGLAVTRDGIPVRCWSWPGNTADMSVLEQVKKDLMGWKLGRVISVLDRGFCSDDNLRTLQRGGGHYIIGEKLRSGKRDVEEALSKRGPFTKVNEKMEIKEIIVGDGEARKRYVLVKNSVQAKRDKEKRKETIKRLQAELDAIGDLKGEAHTKSICRLVAHPTYGRYIKLLSNGQPRLDKAKIKQEEKLDGKYLIRTSDDTLRPEDVALGYKQLIDIENAFRTIKQTLEIRPVYHRLSDRIRAHVLLCWLGLLLIRIAENETGHTWREIIKAIDKIHVVEFLTDSGYVKQRTQIDKFQKNIFKRLNIAEPPEILAFEAKTP